VRTRFASQSGLFSHVLTWVVPAAAAAVAALHQGLAVDGDSHLFIWAGQTLLSSQWSRAFALPAVQAGPLQLALFGSVGHWHAALALVLTVGTALLVVAAARAAGLKSPPLLCGTGVLAVVAGVTGTGLGGHPADAVLPLLWIIAAGEARRGHAWRAGLLIGLSAGLETWGLLGVAVLALAPRQRDALAGTVLAGISALALFTPFMLGGHFHMLSLHWYVTNPSPLSMLVPQGTSFAWPLRLVQAVFAVSAGVAVVRVLRRSPHVVWAAPLAIIVVRLLLDPLLFSYYLAGPKALILVGAALGAARWLQQRARRESRAEEVTSELVLR
jgi:hypothetical protein